MNRDSILATLRSHLPELRREYGVVSLALFGSVARNEAGPESDVDLLVEFEPGRTMGLFRYMELEETLGEFLGGRKVDLVMRGAVIPELRPYIFGEAIHV